MVLRGTVQDGGILCDCCHSVISCSQFEAHAGKGSRRAPYDNIRTEDGLTLSKLVRRAATAHETGEDQELGER